MLLIKFLNDGDEQIEQTLHTISPITDHTLCGITMDGDSKTAGNFEVVKSPHITCLQCVQIINHCRGLKTK